MAVGFTCQFLINVLTFSRIRCGNLDIAKTKTESDDKPTINPSLCHELGWGIKII